MVRIGIVGTENSHADHYVRYFNQQGRYGDHRVVALADGPPERHRKLAAEGGIEQVVESAADLIGSVDAAIICSRDGRRHREQAVTLLNSSIPVLVDKPLACDPVDARAILDAAHAAGVVTSSYSALRWAEPVTTAAARLRREDPPDLVAVTGPADATSDYGGIFFYGIHVVEIALALVPHRPVTDVAVTDLGDTVLVTARAGTTRLILEMVRPQSRTQVPWRIVATTSAGSLVQEVRLPENYSIPGVDVFVRMLECKEAPLPDAELLAPVELLSAVAKELSA